MCELKNVYMCVCIYACMHICLFVYVHACMSMGSRPYVCMYAYISVMHITMHVYSVA